MLLEGTFKMSVMYQSWEETGWGMSESKQAKAPNRQHCSTFKTAFNFNRSQSREQKEQKSQETTFS